MLKEKPSVDRTFWIGGRSYELKADMQLVPQGGRLPVQFRKGDVLTYRGCRYRDFSVFRGHPHGGIMVRYLEHLGMIYLLEVRGSWNTGRDDFDALGA